VDYLANWLWQGCVVGLATSAMLRLLGRSRASVRYAFCWIAAGTVLTLGILPLFSFAASSPQLVPDSPQAASPMLTLPASWWTSSTVALTLWAIWAGVHVIQLGWALLALQRARRRCQPFPGADESRLDHWRSVRVRGRRTRLVLSDDVRSAAVLGCGSPVIAVAPALLEHLDEAELDRVVIHEWAHVQRRDDLLNLAQLAVRGLAGWHPAIWWLDRQLQIEREAACDETAVAVTGCAKGYAASLARTASLLPARRSTLPVVGALSSPSLRKRILRILSRRRPLSTMWSVSVTVIGAGLLIGLTVGVGGLRVIGRALAAPFEPDRIALLTPSDQAAATGARAIPISPAQDRRPPPKKTVDPAADPQMRTTRHTDPAADRADSIAAPLAPAADAGDPAGPDGPNVPLSPPITHIAPDRLPVVSTVALGAPPPNPQAVNPEQDSPWAVAADAGVSVGRASQKAAVATAGFFSRLSRKIAGSF
jgi:beta-lactamase regulating signal transducer with metallopeptidase domain